MKRKRYTEDLEFKISDEEPDDADAAGRDSPSNTSQSEQQVGAQVCAAWLQRGSQKLGGGVGGLCAGNVHLVWVSVLWEMSCLGGSFKKPCSLKFIFAQACDM